MEGSMITNLTKLIVKKNAIGLFGILILSLFFLSCNLPAGPNPKDTTPPVPGAAGALTVKNITSTSLDLSWEKASDNKTNQANLEYRVFSAKSEAVISGSIDSVIASATARNNWATNIGTLSVTGLTESTAYYFIVFVRDDTGNIGGYKHIEATTEGDKSSAPVITLKGLSEVDVIIDTEFNDPGWTATDDVDGDISDSVVVSGDTVDTSIEDAVYHIHYDVSDSEGNAAARVTRTVTVITEDTTPPVITLNGSTTMDVPQGSDFTDPGATAQDNVDGDITSSIVVTGIETIDTSVIGSYSLSYDVSDSSDNAATTVTRTVNVVENQPPVADAGPDVTIDPGDYTLDGSNSSDPEGQTLLYQWEITYPGGSIYTSSWEETAEWQYYLNEVGVYTAVLTVDDGQNTSTDEVSITVNNIAPIAEILSPSVEGSYLTDNSIELRGYAYDPNTNPQAAAFYWELITTPVDSTSEISDPNSSLTSLIPDIPGDYTIILTVIDEIDESLTDSAQVTITVGDSSTQGGVNVTIQ
jgi:hypothetical protein